MDKKKQAFVTPILTASSHWHNLADDTDGQQHDTLGTFDTCLHQAPFACTLNTSTKDPTQIIVSFYKVVNAYNLLIKLQ